MKMYFVQCIIYLVMISCSQGAESRVDSMDMTGTQTPTNSTSSRTYPVFLGVVLACAVPA